MAATPTNIPNGSQLQTQVSPKNEYWFRLGSLLIDAIIPAIKSVLHNDLNDPTYVGLPRDEKLLYNQFNTTYFADLNRLLAKKLLSVNQLTILLPQCQKTNSDEFDATLTILLIRNLLQLSCSSPKWSWEQIQPNDVSKSACVIRAREFRNFICHTNPNSIDNQTFHDKWFEGVKIVKDLQYQCDLQRLKVQPLDATTNTNTLHLIALEQKVDSIENLAKSASIKAERARKESDVAFSKAEESMLRLKSFKSRTDDGWKLAEQKFEVLTAFCEKINEGISEEKNVTSPDKSIVLIKTIVNRNEPDKKSKATSYEIGCRNMPTFKFVACFIVIIGIGLGIGIALGNGTIDSCLKISCPGNSTCIKTGNNIPLCRCNNGYVSSDGKCPSQGVRYVIQLNMPSMIYEPTLSNPTSEAFVTLAIPLEYEIMIILRPKVPNILGTKVQKFSEGSVLAHVSIIMNSSEPFLTTTTSALIFETLINETKDGKLGNITVDPTYTRMVRDPMKPVLLISHTTPNYGDNIIFTCNVTFNDGADDYRWYYNDETIFGENKETYIITNVTSKNDGVYHCTATSMVWDFSTSSDKKTLDIDECITNNGGCHPKAECKNTVGLQNCICKAGYTGNGVKCNDIDECIINNGGCHPLAECNNTVGSRSCICKAGYIGNGVTCSDIDECIINNGGCHPMADCNNTVGSRSCTCKSGYKGNGVNCKLFLAGCATKDIMFYPENTKTNKVCRVYPQYGNAIFVGYGRYTSSNGYDFHDYDNTLTQCLEKCLKTRRSGGVKWGHMWLRASDGFCACMKEARGAWDHSSDWLTYRFT